MHGLGQRRASHRLRQNVTDSYSKTPNLKLPVVLLDIFSDILISHIIEYCINFQTPSDNVPERSQNFFSYMGFIVFWNVWLANHNRVFYKYMVELRLLQINIIDMLLNSKCGLSVVTMANLVQKLSLIPIFLWGLLICVPKLIDLPQKETNRSYVL